MDFATVTNLKNRPLTRGNERDIIGIHTMEAPEGSQTAENVANYFKQVQADSHWCHDDNSRVRVIPDWAIAWTLPGANSRSLNHELAGYAKQDAEDWDDEFSIDMLEIVAYTCAQEVIEFGIPVRRLTDAQIASGQKGFAGHVDVNRVYHQSSHWDPGPSFPWTYFLGRVNAYVALLRSGTPVAERPKPNWNNRGYSKAWIKAQQHKLVDLGYKLTPDGKLGAITREVVRKFQESVGLNPDGVPGPATSKALDAKLARNQDGSVRKPRCKVLQQAVRADDDNVWGVETDKHCNAVREASAWGGRDFPYGVKFTQLVVGTKQDGDWGPKSEAAHDDTVVAVQTALRAMGFNPGRIDGRWGENTEEAYKAARRACRV
jgi:hypothetical protein